MNGSRPVPQRRPGRLARPAWFRASETGVHHVDPECPALRDLLGEDAAGFRTIYELDLSSGDVWQWRADQETGYKAWYRWSDMAAPSCDIFDALDALLPARPSGSPDRRLGTELTSWRSCLRCGSVAVEPHLVTCPRCHLTACDCDD